MIPAKRAVILSRAKNLRSSSLSLLLLVLALASQVLPSSAQTYTTPNAPLLGSAWYPEQWPESRWDADLQLMQDAHFNVVRIGEFAWSTEEPSEGHYDLDWLDRAIALAARHHLKVVMSTPTDAPPAWLTSKYPDTLGTNADGHLREHGNRRQFNYASPHYRQLCAQIVTKLAERFGKNPNILGWQIGNEYTDESFDPATRAQFQQFLKSRYKTLDNLNARWSTSYWSQTYTDWSQIPLEASHGNPGLLLEHKHFVTATWRSFQREQLDILRPRILPTQFLTTNIGGLAWSDNWDHYAMTQDLDLASWDEYVGQGHLDAPKEAMLNDFVRGWKRQNFWIMETQPGSVNWAPVNNALAPGETRALAWQAIGHGADAVLYWQWRAALNGQEQYHGAIAGPDGKPLPIYAELQQLGHDFELTRAALAGTTPHAEVALLTDYDSRWAIDFQLHTRLYDQQQILLRFYEPLSRIAQAAGHAIDIIDPTASTHPEPSPSTCTAAPCPIHRAVCDEWDPSHSACLPADLTRYKLLVAPSLNVIDDALAAKLLAYVRQGGHLLLGPRSGMKDAYNALNPQRQPGPLAQALAAKVDQYYALDTPVPLQGDAGQGTADIWAEALTPPHSGSVDLTYADPAGWLDHQPAMVTTPVGKGSLSYLGTLPQNDLMAHILFAAAEKAHVSGAQALPASGVELSVRTPQSGSHVLILINHNTVSAQALLQGRFQPLVNDGTLSIATVPSQNPSSPPHDSTIVDLPPQGVAVLIPEPAK